MRFTLLDGELIFNWEGNPRDLRLDLPIRPPRNGVADGNIGRDQWADIEIQVFRHSIGVFVDGRLRHVAKGSTVGLYTRAGSTVYVREFSVKKLEDAGESLLLEAGAKQSESLLQKFRQEESRGTRP